MTGGIIWMLTRAALTQLRVDVIDLQAQSLEHSTATYADFVRAAAAQQPPEYAHYFCANEHK
jgi:hypothetical protein